MIKLIVASVAAALVLSACGGGGSSSAASTPVLKLSFSGAPITGTAAPVAAVQRAAVIHAASDSSASDAAATIVNLTDALAATGVTANVTVQTMDATGLHAAVMAVNGGASPPASAYGTVDPTNWNIVNFTFDDMVTTMDSPMQLAAQTQFENDLTVFTQDGYVAGMKTFDVVPIPTCDAAANLTAASGLSYAIEVAEGNSLSFPVGAIQPSEAAGHMGADCRTPDAYILNLQTTRIASDIATRWNLVIHPTTPAAGS